jgi:ComF family protein
VKIFSDALNWIYPRICPICNEITEEKQGICFDCIAKLTLVDGSLCLKCGKPMEHYSEICDDCTKGKLLYFEKNIPIFIYEPILKKVIYGFKYSFDPHSASVFGALMGRKLLGCEEYSSLFSEYKNELAVISVPLHKNRLRKRGYNQSEILAKKVASALNKPFINDSIIRIKDTLPQAGIMKINEREENVRDAFLITRPEIISSKHILIVDDIYTTGSTINELARIISNLSGKQVFSVTLAIAVKQSDDD